ncbi:hypothetical protein Nans01_34120 [Nocardiopsis ansamitocini]|uniref:Uncharacterized protein n=1 Tax=Nocardiopsis ansamitocini TaxID=1670832 RepID=A0A9W6P8H7_9ACTN|nr:hypothetical protein Nans01_34120 [Nocardiopsis ansamitocini]
MYLLMFGLPIVAIIVIIGFARYQASPVERDEREDERSSEE